MVVFTCQHCGDSLKKTKVEKHYVTKCRFKNPSVTCVDCLKDFVGEEYTAHTKCMTEAERYSAKGTVVKESSGQNKQEKYVEMIQVVLNSSELTNTQRLLLEACSKFDNVPRKLKKFQNFMKNTTRNIRHNDEDLKSVFQLLENAWKKEIESKNANKTPKKHSTSEIKKDLATNENGNTQEEYITANDTSISPSKSIKKKKNKDGNQSLVVEEEVLTENGNLVENGKENINGSSNKKKKHDNNKSLVVEETALTENDNCDKDTNENINSISKKDLKKQKKYEKYLRELENQSKPQNHDENCSDNHFTKTKKKSKKLKMDQINSESSHPAEDDNVESSNAMEVRSKERHRNKKRKMEPDTLCETASKKKKEIPTEDEQQTEPQASFNWADIIVRILESQPDKKLSVKRLGKKVIDEYQTVISDHRTYDELLAKFNKKVKKTVGVRVLKDKAQIVE